METLENKRGKETVLKRIKGAELETIRAFAEEIVNAIAKGQYGLIPQKLCVDKGRSFVYTSI
jgi:hypothetical protein